MSGGSETVPAEIDLVKCLLCHEKPCTMALLPCGHLCACVDCATTCEQKSCPIPHCAELVESAMAIKEGDTRLEP